MYVTGPSAQVSVYYVDPRRLPGEEAMFRTYSDICAAAIMRTGGAHDVKAAHMLKAVEDARHCQGSDNGGRTASVHAGHAQVKTVTGL
eukprot:234833-Prorocentrum_minimum.AAC.1